jgi:hypothetical protein
VQLLGQHLEVLLLGNQRHQKELHILIAISCLMMVRILFQRFPLGVLSRVALELRMKSLDKIAFLSTLRKR